MEVVEGCGARAGRKSTAAALRTLRSPARKCARPPARILTRLLAHAPAVRAGAVMPGEFEERLKAVLKELTEPTKKWVCALALLSACMHNRAACVRTVCVACLPPAAPHAHSSSPPPRPPPCPQDRALHRRPAHHHRPQRAAGARCADTSPAPAPVLRRAASLCAAHPCVHLQHPRPPNAL